MIETSLQTDSPWPHRLAVLLACATFPLIWVGGLVTTYGAGMAVPDWPTTYGYNLFLYPWQTWVYGPWDLFIEHGHRLFAAAVGLLTIALAVALWRRDDRPWIRRLGLVAVVGVVAQGALGGLRVRLDQRLLAQIHGCVAPAFFALTAALAVFTSRRWRNGADQPSPIDRGIGRLALVTTLLVYAQLLLGSQLRHVSPMADATFFRAAVMLHLFLAAILSLHVAAIFVRAGGRRSGAWLARPARGLAALIVVQLGLGCAAWVVKYGWPAWLSEYDWAAGYVVSRESPMQALLTTAHVATGSLILAVCVTLTLRAIRRDRGRLRPAALGKLGMGVVA
ncbi:MAG TPA: COX15/CtaA family protein [Pirellulales bacterium]|nr:COX15/CtaA family protein [Pirellulales bacterium]